MLLMNSESETLGEIYPWLSIMIVWPMSVKL